ncbi:hypothetical protein TNCV_1978031 [Trichonephila clavipes]|nr:hypothetical protein TNCV_1978031 [Trichonephila clavipes]
MRSDKPKFLGVTVSRSLHENDSMEQWATVLFTDEFEFRLTSDSGRTLTQGRSPCPPMSEKSTLTARRLDCLGRHHIGWPPTPSCL